VSPGIFVEEKERIFVPKWFRVGRAEEAPRPGDDLVRDLLGESVIIVRGE
jgi:Rieske 2Fe-2S family protein